MRKSFIRPLNYNYVDPNQKRINTQDIPLKFIKEQDNYQPRKRKDQFSVNQQESQRIQTYPQPQILQHSHISEQVASQQPEHQPQQSILQHPQPQTKSSFFSCCQMSNNQPQLCSRCAHAICPSCKIETSRINNCTKCLQKICSQCKQHMKISFPDYEIRNDQITLKNYDNLHFSGCQCKECTQFG